MFTPDFLRKLTANDKSTWHFQYAHSLGIQAYVYGFPWLYLSQLRYLWATEDGAKIAEDHELTLPSAPINSFFYADLATPENQTGGAPSVDHMYFIAWLDLSEPVVLSVPEVTDRYYTVQMFSMDSDNFAYVGLRTTGSMAGNYLIKGPNWVGTVPEESGILDVLAPSRTKTAGLFGRMGVNDIHDQKDIDKAKHLQKQCVLTPLSCWGNGPYKAPWTKLRRPISLKLEQSLGTWRDINAAMTENPPGQLQSDDQSQIVKLFSTVGVGPNQSVESQLPQTREGLRLAASQGLGLLKDMSAGLGKEVNGWNYPAPDIGRAGLAGDFITRASLQAYAGVSANDASESVYLNTGKDSDGRSLSGEHTYKIMMKKDDFPQVFESMYGFWSLTLYEKNELGANLIPDSTNYMVGSHSWGDNVPNKVTVIMSPEDPNVEGSGVYWLQTPKTTSSSPGEFFIFLRIYLPYPEVAVTQTWVPPKIQRST